MRLQTSGSSPRPEAVGGPHTQVWAAVLPVGWASVHTVAHGSVVERRLPYTTVECKVSGGLDPGADTESLLSHLVGHSK